MAQLTQTRVERYRRGLLVRSTNGTGEVDPAEESEGEAGGGVASAAGGGEGEPRDMSTVESDIGEPGGDGDPARSDGGDPAEDTKWRRSIALAVWSSMLVDKKGPGGEEARKDGRKGTQDTMRAGGARQTVLCVLYALPRRRVQWHGTTMTLERRGPIRCGSRDHKCDKIPDLGISVGRQIASSIPTRRPCDKKGVA